MLIIEVPDSDFAEAEFDKVLAREFGSSIVGYRKLQDTKKMLEKDSFFKSINNTYKKSKETYYNYIHEHNGKYIK